MKTDFELYIHIPFCVRKCGYCDFLSFPAGEQERERYLQALKEEIREAGRSAGETDAQGKVSTVFIGGGTPTVLLPDQITDLMQTVFSVFPVCSDAEITIEANPGTVDPEKLKAYIAEHPDAYQSEMAEIFGCSEGGIRYVLRKQKITRKKRQRSTKNRIHRK